MPQMIALLASGHAGRTQSTSSMWLKALGVGWHFLAGSARRFTGVLVKIERGPILQTCRYLDERQDASALGALEPRLT
jgi:hypothetical protein